jgi:predicted MPP superfamily phosphohydrolase
VGTISGILTIFFCVDAWIWLRLDRMLCQTRRPWLWRTLLAVAMLAVMLCTLLSLLEGSMLATEHRKIPRWAPAALYIWHFLIMPLTAVGLLIGLVAGRIAEYVRSRRASSPVDAAARAPSTAPLPAGPTVSRRGFLTAAAFAVPPLATAGLTGVALGQLGHFRVRPMDLKLAGWPRELDGFTLSVIADVHLGVFSTPRMPHDIVEASNALHPDLVLLPGDLINISQADLPAGLDMVRKLDSRYGIYMVQGNHDLIQGPGGFNGGCKKAGVPLLVDQVVTLKPKGAPFQLLGTRWAPSPHQMIRSVDATCDPRDPSLFGIMMAHHPHNWDQAAQRGVPLVLSGHTHGGQIMLTDHIGGGPLRFRYWSGLYRKPKSTLIVSNGVGDWFPLRINAPAEILHITLHPEETS